MLTDCDFNFIVGSIVFFVVCAFVAMAGEPAGCKHGVETVIVHSRSAAPHEERHCIDRESQVINFVRIDDGRIIRK